MQLLFVRRAHDSEDWLPANRHFCHDLAESMPGGTRFRFHRAGAGVEDERQLRKEREDEKNEQNRERDPKDQARCGQSPADIPPNDIENPVVPRGMGAVRG